MLSLYRKLFPFSARDAGVPGLARPLTTQECARELAKAGAKKRADATMRLIRERCVELQRGPISPIASRDSVVAPVRALREVRG